MAPMTFYWYMYITHMHISNFNAKSCTVLVCTQEKLYSLSVHKRADRQTDRQTEWHRKLSRWKKGNEDQQIMWSVAQKKQQQKQQQQRNHRFLAK